MAPGDRGRRRLSLMEMRRFASLLALAFALARPASGAGLRAPVLVPALSPAPLAAPVLAPRFAPGALPTLNAADAPSLADPVVESELSPEHLALIETRAAKGVERAETLLREDKLERGGYLLGIGGNGRHAEFADATGLTPFDETYIELFGRLHPVRTPEFLDYLTGSGEEVVFLVPPKALTHPDAKVTKEELEWLFENPDRMKSVRFVFGAYDLDAEALARRRKAIAPSDDRLRVEQARRHARRADPSAVDPVAADPEELVDAFTREIGRAPMVRERASLGLFAFQTAAGTFVARRIRRGYFLEMFPAGGGVRREAFVSKRTMPWLFARVHALQ